MTEKLKPAFACDYARMWDLCRYQRGDLLESGLITREEYVTLAAEETNGKPGQGSPSPRRLESYDELRAKLVALNAARAEAVLAFADDQEMQWPSRLHAQRAAREFIAAQGWLPPEPKKSK